jgi:hypothetical protein
MDHKGIQYQIVPKTGRLPTKDVGDNPITLNIVEPKPLEFGQDATRYSTLRLQHFSSCDDLVGSCDDPGDSALPRLGNRDTARWSLFKSRILPNRQPRASPLLVALQIGQACPVPPQGQARAGFPMACSCAARRPSRSPRRESVSSTILDAANSGQTRQCSLFRSRNTALF